VTGAAIAYLAALQRGKYLDRYIVISHGGPTIGFSTRDRVVTNGTQGGWSGVFWWWAALAAATSG